MARIPKKKPVDKVRIGLIVSVVVLVLLVLFNTKSTVTVSDVPPVTIVCPSFPTVDRTQLSSYDDGTYRSVLYVETKKVK